MPPPKASMLSVESPWNPCLTRSLCMYSVHVRAIQRTAVGDAGSANPRKRGRGRDVPGRGAGVQVVKRCRDGEIGRDPLQKSRECNMDWAQL